MWAAKVLISANSDVNSTENHPTLKPHLYYLLKSKGFYLYSANNLVPGAGLEPARQILGKGF